jgi:hypothetical protein
MPNSERQILHVFSHMWNLDLKIVIIIVIHGIVSGENNEREG